MGKNRRGANRAAGPSTSGRPLSARADTNAPASLTFSPRREAIPAVRVALLGGFDLAVGDASVAITNGSERLLAFVALHCLSAVPRSLVAGTLWPETPEHCAFANLRSALARLRHVSRRVVDVGPNEIRLGRHINVDIHDARSLARRILDPAMRVDTLDLTVAVIGQLSVDLLPGWYDDWALSEAEEWRQLRLHALEKLAQDFITGRRFVEAVTAASAAVRADPLRESSQASLIRAHLAEGNQSEALHDFERYEKRLQDDLGLHPTNRLCQLMADLRTVMPR